MQNHSVTSRQVWSNTFGHKTLKLKLFLAPAIFFVYAAFTRPLGVYIETRKGVQLDDQLLSFFPTSDYSLPIFLLLYISLAVLVFAHVRTPSVIVSVLEMHFYVAVVRQCCILLVALEPPEDMILLRDIFLENTVYPHASPLTKDLFFSGHVASIWIYFLNAQGRGFKIYFLFATLLMSFMVLCMRIHYTYDVYGALLITSLIYYIPLWFRASETKERLRKLLLVFTINK